jgi:DNA mismatch endonuclease (patch repair protein)
MSSDVFAPEQRSAVMRAVKSRDTGPELKVREAVRAAGFARRYRLDGRGLPGKPDLVFAGLGKVVFVNGCFWHGHDCRRGARMPKANAAYWRAKIGRNVERDRASLAALKASGWSTLVVWECETRERAALVARLKRFLATA